MKQIQKQTMFGAKFKRKKEKKQRSHTLTQTTSKHTLRYLVLSQELSKGIDEITENFVLRKPNNSSHTHTFL